MPAYDYKCEGGHVNEIRWDTYAEAKDTIPCPELPALLAGDFPLVTKMCERPAKRQFATGLTVIAYLNDDTGMAPPSRRGIPKRHV